MARLALVPTSTAEADAQHALPGLLSSALLEALCVARDAFDARRAPPSSGARAPEEAGHEEGAMQELRELTLAEARLAELLLDVRAALATCREGRAAAAAAEAAAAEAAAAEGAAAEDALNEWYEDPFAARAARCTVGTLGRARHASGMAQVFLIEENDDAATEIEGHCPSIANLSDLLESPDGKSGSSLGSSTCASSTAGSNVGEGPDLQYGQCVAAKLAELCPAGSPELEQLLAVLLAVFGLPQDQQRRLLAGRRGTSTLGSILGLGRIRCLGGSRATEGTPLEDGV